MSAESIFEHREPVRKPGWRKALPWIVGVIAVGALFGFVGFKYSNTADPEVAPVLTNVPADDRSAVPPTVKLQPGATKVARQFIKTAVARKDLDTAYGLVTEALKQGQSRAEWRTGNIAVVPYPVESIEYAPMKIDYSYPKEAMVEIALLPKPGAKIRSQLFTMTLVKRNDKWLVDSWVPKSSPMVPNGSENNGGS